MAVATSTLLRGYRTAFARWMSGPRVSSDAEEAFLGIFEVLNWAVVVDDRLRHADPAGNGWAAEYSDGAVMAGFRYARNAVHHDWDEALFLKDGVTLPTPLPAGLFDWCWKPTLSARKRGGMTQYSTHLASRPVRFSMETLLDLYSDKAK